jgi:hypothetical protein
MTMTSLAEDHVRLQKHPQVRPHSLKFGLHESGHKSNSFKFGCNSLNFGHNSLKFGRNSLKFGRNSLKFSGAPQSSKEKISQDLIMFKTFVKSNT